MTQLPSIKMKFDYGLLAIILALVIIIEGAILATSADGALKLENVGLIMQSTVQLGGIQLLVLGLMALIALVLPHFLFKDNKIISKVLGLIPALVALMVIIEALALAYYAAPTSMAGIDYGSHVLAVSSAQLFFVGAALLSSRMLRGRENLGLTIITFTTLVLGSIGVFIIGIAAMTTIVGMGMIMGSTVLLAGLQLLVTSMVLLLLLFLGDRKFLLREFFGVTLSTLGIMFLGLIVSIEGLVLVSYSAQITVAGIGVMMERTMLLFGLIVAFLGLAIPVMVFSRVKPNRKVGDVAMYAVVFLLLLFPFALFT